MTKLIITRHANYRIKERAGLNRKAARRLSIRAYEEGICENDVSGQLRRYILYSAHNAEKISEKYEVRIYGDFLYLFAETSEEVTLITVFWVPKRLKKQSYAAQRRKSA